MQIKIFTIPIMGGEKLNEELNTFLRSRKILQVENQIVNNAQGAFWCFCVKYIDQQATKSFTRKEKVDYREVLDETSFRRFVKMKEIRKRIAKEESIPAYAVFTNEELAALAKIEHLTPAAMEKVNGIGKKKVEKFGHYFLSDTDDHEKS